MDSSNPGPLLGRFKAENAENILKAYRIVMDVKETGKSYILQLVEFESRYSASHISHLFSKSKRRWAAVRHDGRPTIFRKR